MQFNGVKVLSCSLAFERLTFKTTNGVNREVKGGGCNQEILEEEAQLAMSFLKDFLIATPLYLTTTSDEIQTGVGHIHFLSREIL